MLAVLRVEGRAEGTGRDVTAALRSRNPRGRRGLGRLRHGQRGERTRAALATSPRYDGRRDAPTRARVGRRRSRLLPSLLAEPADRRPRRGLDDLGYRGARLPRRGGRCGRRQRRPWSRPRSPRSWRPRPAPLAYAHGSAFTNEPLEAYAREVGRPPAPRRAGDLPGQRGLGGDRDGAEDGARLPPRPRRGGPPDRHRPLGQLPRQHASARSTCPGAVRCAARTRAGSGGSATSARPTPTGPGTPARNALGTTEELALELERTIENAGPRTVAAFVAEPIVGATLAAGVPPDGYWPAIAEVCRRHGVLLIADEVMTGFGRTGRWFGMDHWGVRPDILVAAKGATSGYWPFGFAAASGHVREVDRAGRVRPRLHLLPLTSSARRSPVRCCASWRPSRWSRRRPSRASD